MVRSKIITTFAVIAFLFLLFGSRSHAFYTETFEYNGSVYPYTKTQEVNLVNYAYNRFTTSIPIYGFVMVHPDGNKTLVMANKDSFGYYMRDEWGNLNHSTAPKQYGVYMVSDLGKFTTPDLPNFNVSFSISDRAPFLQAFADYLRSSDFVDIVDPISVDVYNAKNDDIFALSNPRASVTNGVLTCTWNMPYSLPPKYHSMPLLVDLLITDNDTGVRSIYHYPLASDLPDADRLTFYDVEDLSLRLSLAKIPNLPQSFKIDFVLLTPYYTVPLLAFDDVYTTYKGQTSMIYLNFNGTFNGVVQILPVDPIPPIEPDDPEWNLFTMISNFFSGFFNNFTEAMKILFIPDSLLMQQLIHDTEEFFSARLGFLWFPFDLALIIVETFTSGQADSVITVPPITLNILGGVELFSGGEFDIDPVGIFVYVRMVTSIVLSCRVALMAYKKWDEWIGGHDV